MLKINEKMYGKFSPTERLNLTIAALARDDFEEATLLGSTCPYVNCVTRDLNYRDRLESFTMIGLVFLEQCGFYYQRIELMDTALALYGVMNTHPDYMKKMENEIKTTSNAKEKYISCLKSLYEAFKHFCQVAELKYEEVIRGMGIEKRYNGMNEYLTSDIKPNVELTQKLAKDLLKGWKFG